MELDDDVCLCFHVSRRKLENWARIERPRRVSEMSLCGGAGTGCGWCRTLLQTIFDEAASDVSASSALDQVAPADHSSGRARHLRNRRSEP